MQKRKVLNGNKKYLKKQFVLLIIVIIYLLSISFISGRYVLKKVNTHFSSSKEFYFYSDKLKKEAKGYTVIWNGQECKIPISLYTEMNSLKKLERDIEYIVECTASDKITYTIDELTDIADESNTGFNKKGTVLGLNSETGEGVEKNRSSFTININKNVDGKITASDDIEITVTVKTIGDFEETLQETFKLVLQDGTGVTYKIDDVGGRAYCNLIVSNMTDTLQTVTLNLNQEGQEFLIDTTNDIFSELKSYEVISDDNPLIKEVVFDLESKSNIDIKLYKRDRGENYTNSNKITVTY